MEYDYGLSPGDRIRVIWGKKKQYMVQHVTVVREYPRFIRVDVGAYRTSINKADLITGGLTIQKIGGNDHERK